jgi:elongation factor Ts
MSVIDAKMVKILRDKTSAGMMDCKKALEKTQGNMALAVEELRKSGKDKAAKRAGCIATEGVVILLTDDHNKHGMLLELNSETDFVARDANFLAFAKDVAATAWAYKMTNNVSIDLATLSEQKSQRDSQYTIEEARQALIGTVGENIILRRLVFSTPLSNPAIQTLGHYVHGNRIGVMLTLDVNNQELAKDIAMHIAANRPVVIMPHQVPEALIAQEKEIYLAEASISGKPPEIIDKMVTAGIDSFTKQVSLVGQPFIKNPAITVGELLLNSGAMVLEFHRFEVGENIENHEALAESNATELS